MKNRNLVNLNINPCKMCMPMGGVMAFKGIEKSMVILHGSQGCSTYIRRHMATHYNEPIDIASSSLTENGTVYGGADNLKKGLKNVIKLYSPKVIGVMTTCLAETIGEDLNRIVTEFCSENNKKSLPKIITVPSPGYSGTQAEGYYRALRNIVEQMAEDITPYAKINIICANLNPGDIRNIKNILNKFDAQYIMLPDVSNTLDSPHLKEYKKIPEGGTKLEDIAKMPGAIATIEMSLTVDDDYSPGMYLQQVFGVPLYRCAVPIGFKATEDFVSLISQITGKEIPQDLIYEKGRYIDAVIDSHKYNGEGRAVIYGEPELVNSITSLCLENGIKPVLIATGSKNTKMAKLINSNKYKTDDDIMILNDTDFETIEKYAKELKANIMIGNSDGRRISEKLDIPLVRIGFPIHDRMGAQRRIFTGYYGSLELLDNITNTLLERKDRNYRKNIYEEFHIDKSSEKVKANMNLRVVRDDNMISIEEKTKTHPCYNGCAHDYARMHVPVAPKCNVSCNYCSRKYDCANESRPGVTSEVLTPEEALEKFKVVKAKMKNLSVVGIAGPGDALANFEETRRTIELIKFESPDTTFCLSTNGLMLPFYANEIIELGVSHVTITINTIDPEIAGKIYKEVNYLGTRYTGVEAGKIILNNQLFGLKYLTSKGVICKVNIVMVKGVNDSNIEATVKKVKEYGAFMTNIMQMIPAPDSVFEKMPLVTNIELNDMRKKCESDLKQMYHCKQCRADAIGTLGNDCSIDFRNKDNSENIKKKKPEKVNEEIKEEILPEVSYKFAIASKSGINIDQHFGHAKEFYMYNYDNGNVTFVEKRDVDKYCNGIQDCEDTEDKIEKIITTISD
ncbi:MAG: nitrogenase cofactor biosynthesis protein NifB, partial [Bacillota bacterium]|nr:nitrogenase cofactor biosynthesis protein NifB [Bacillota bacterium]